MRFDHIGVVVADIEKGREFLSQAFQIESWTEIVTDTGIGVCVQFGIGESGPCYELIAPLTESSPVWGALKSVKNILSHVAYLVADMEKASNKLRAQGSVPTADPQPAIAYGGRKVQFFITPLRFMVELIEAPNHRHDYRLQTPRKT